MPGAPVPGSKLRLGVGLVAVVVLAAGWTAAAVLTGDLEADTVTTLATTAGILASLLASRSLGHDVEWLVLGTTSYSGRNDRPLDRATIALPVRAFAVLALLALWSTRDAQPQDAVFALLAFNALTLLANLFPLPG